MLKTILRKKNLKKRQIYYRKKKKINLNKVIWLIKKFKIKNPIIGGYYPVNYEIDCLEILENLELKKYKISLPIIKKDSSMEFYTYSFKEALKTNIYGIPEPYKKKIIKPNILFVPMVSFDKNRYRIGYGGGFYDRYISRQKKRKNFFTLGFAYSFQQTNNIPKQKFDEKLDLIITEKKIFK